MAQIQHQALNACATLDEQAHAMDALTPVSLDGKFLSRGGERFYVRGVTYGTFAPDDEGNDYGPPERVKEDFTQMAAAGINSVRIYTPPPEWLLDLAADHGLSVMVGIPWEQHTTFLDDSARAGDIVSRVRAAVRECANHPAVLCFVIGNEIPATIVRWHGKHAIERFLRRLYDAAKDEAPDTLVTYVNFPSTEYLDVSFVDFYCFNVYLEDRDRLAAYIARLHVLARDKPLVLAEVGLDSLRNGEDTQAEVLAWQIETCFGSGVAGMFLFSWTDEWQRGGHDVEDWSFGLTTRDRSPKPALESVRRAFKNVPFPPGVQWPKVSVLVCTHNGSATLGKCLTGLQTLDYPDYEVIVVSDGSTDSTHEILNDHTNVRSMILDSNEGLSNARNVAASEATGEIVAYIDDDAYPDRQWLKYLVLTFLTTDHAGVGGPNIPPPGVGWIADCVASSPGGPTHVLFTDSVAEHIPGCNMAFRRDVLLEVGGFDKSFRIAGDDVDLCWRLQMAGYTLGFNAAAQVWHHRRDSVRAYLRQQLNYGRAEAMLERKWPHKYNALGHVPWSGRIYGREVSRHFLPGRSRIYQGKWGLAPFQRIYEPKLDLLSTLVCLPDWYLVIVGLVFLCALGVFWPPLLMAAPLLGVFVALSLMHASLSARDAVFDATAQGPVWKKRMLTAVLTLLQPIVRLRGRLERGLTPWRTRGTAYPAFPRIRTFELWYEAWQPYEAHLAALEYQLRDRGAVVNGGGNYSRRDLVVRGGILGAVSVLMGVEEHGEGKQLVRFRVTPVLKRYGVFASIVFLGLAVVAAVSGSWTAFAGLTLAAGALLFRAFYECGTAMAAINDVLNSNSHRIKSSTHATDA